MTSLTEWQRKVQSEDSDSRTPAVETCMGPFAYEVDPASFEAGRRAGLEAAARVADAEADDIAHHAHLARDGWQQGRMAMARTIADAIRALA